MEFYTELRRLLDGVALERLGRIKLRRARTKASCSPPTRTSHRASPMGGTG